MALSNWEISVYALYMLGGTNHLVHTEDVALKCYEFAPHAFSWIKHPDHPDKGVARSSLVDARKDKYGALVKGRVGRRKGQTTKTTASPISDGWQLTEDGIEWIKENHDRFISHLDEQIEISTRQESMKHLNRIRKHKLFLEFQQMGDSFIPSIGELADMLRCRVDASDHIWNTRFMTFKNEAKLVDQQEILKFLTQCESLMPSLL